MRLLRHAPFFLFAVAVTVNAQTNIAIQIQALPLKVHTPSDGSLVGGPDGTPSDPLRFAALQGKPGQSTATRFVVDGSNKAGSQYPDIEYYSLIREDKLEGFSGGPLYLDLDLTPDANVSSYAQCLETTTIYVAKGRDGKTYKYNVATQIDVAGNWTIDGISPKEEWASSGLQTAPLDPNVSHHIRIAYSFNLERHTKSILSYTVDGETFNLPASFQNLAGERSSWSPGIFTQWQWGLNKAFGAFSVLVDNGTYSY
jgi:hypothetical protein